MELEQILTRLAEGARQVLQADGAAVHLVETEGARFKIAAVCGLPASLEQAVSAGQACSPLEEEALGGQPVVVTDARTDPRAVNVPGDFHSLLCLPLICEDAPLGTLQVYTVDPRQFDEDDVRLLAPLAEMGAVAIAKVCALGALEEVTADKSRFVRIVTHELRAPVSVTQSLVRGVLQGYAGELSDKQADVFARISRRLDLLEDLVNDLLDLAVGQAPSLDQEESPVSLNGSIGRAMLLLQPGAEEKGLDVSLDLCREQLVVWGTEEGLDRIFVNLVGNAIKYTPSGGTVIVTMRCLEGFAQVDVADSGIGIPEKALPQLFAPFYRAPNAKDAAVGTGLGLAIVKDLATRFGGRIAVESQEGEGSTFTVTLPIHQLG